MTPDAKDSHRAGVADEGRSYRNLFIGQRDPSREPNAAVLLGKVAGRRRISFSTETCPQKAIKKQLSLRNLAVKRQNLQVLYGKPNPLMTVAGEHRRTCFRIFGGLGGRGRQIGSFCRFLPTVRTAFGEVPLYEKNFWERERDKNPRSRQPWRVSDTPMPRLKS